MTAFDYDNLPDSLDVDPVPAELQDRALAVAIALLGSDHLLAREVKIAHVYDRKGYLNADTFGGQRNPSYSSSSDDIIVQVSVRVGYSPSPWSTDEALKQLKALEVQTREWHVDEQRKKIEAEIATAEEDALRAEAAAQSARDRLAALKGDK